MKRLFWLYSTAFSALSQTYVIEEVQKYLGVEKANAFAELIDDANNIGYNLYRKLVGKKEWAESADSNYRRTGGEVEARFVEKQKRKPQDKINDAPAPKYATPKSDYLDPNRYLKYESDNTSSKWVYSSKTGGRYENESTILGGRTPLRYDREVSRNDGIGEGRVVSQGTSETVAKGNGAGNPPNNKGDISSGEIKASKEKPANAGSFNAHRDELLSDAEESYGAKYTEDFNETGFMLYSTAFSALSQTRYLDRLYYITH